MHKKENAYRKDKKYAVADDIAKFPERWNNAKSAVDESVRQYEKSGHQAGTYSEFRYVQNSSCSTK